MRYINVDKLVYKFKKLFGPTQLVDYPGNNGTIDSRFVIYTYMSLGTMTRQANGNYIVYFSFISLVVLKSMFIFLMYTMI